MMSKNKSYNILGLLFITSSFYTVYLLRNLRDFFAVLFGHLILTILKYENYQVKIHKRYQ